MGGTLGERIDNFDQQISAAARNNK